MRKIGCVLVLVSFAWVARAETTVQLLKPSDRGPRLTATPSPMTLREQAVIVDPGAFDADVLDIPLFGTTARAKRVSVDFLRDEWTWTGRIDREPESAVLLAREGNAVAGTIIRQSGLQYSIRVVQQGEQILELVNNARARPEGIPASVPASPVSSSIGVEATTCEEAAFPVIDVLVLYTETARQEAGGDDGIRSLIRLASLETSWSFLISGVPAVVRVVHREELQQTDNDQDGEALETNRDRLQNPADGYFDIAQVRREEKGADVVVLIVEDGDYAGMAYVMGTASHDFEVFAYCVVQRQYATGNFTFAHEIGHLMGARHEWTSDCTNGRPFDFNHAYVQWNPTHGRKPWRTMMGTHDLCNRLKIECQRLLRWSDPNARRFNGEKLGVGEPMPTDNHAALKKTARIVAGFRCPKSGN